mmetsp:Transcript_3683/g.11592  ORF Transcript_3683/g.11592 Transcript_3683/m.11592 type:complete len:220 (-) Transcript_3683:374-1033(-)
MAAAGLRSLPGGCGLCSWQLHQGGPCGPRRVGPGRWLFVAEAAATEVGLHIPQVACVRLLLFEARASLDGVLLHAIGRLAQVQKVHIVHTEVSCGLAVRTLVHDVVVRLDGPLRERQGNQDQHEAQQRDEERSHDHQGLRRVELVLPAPEESLSAEEESHQDDAADNDHGDRQAALTPEGVVEVAQHLHGVPDGEEAQHCQQDEAHGHEHVLVQGHRLG